MTAKRQILSSAAQSLLCLAKSLVSSGAREQFAVPGRSITDYLGLLLCSELAESYRGDKTSWPGRPSSGDPTRV